MAKTFYCTDWFGADTILQGGRDKDERVVGNNRRLVRLSEDCIALRLHSTNVVTYHQDGTCTLYMGGWDSVTTKRTLNDYSPARVYSAYRRVKDDEGFPVTTAIWHSSDGLTPPKIQKCRKCHGTGEIVERCDGRYYYGWYHRDRTNVRALPGMVYTEKRKSHTFNRCDLCGAAAYEPCTSFLVPGCGSCEPEMVEHDRYHFATITRDYRERWPNNPCAHGFLESHIHRYDCYACDATGQRDYGSHVMPTPFGSHDQIRVAEDGKVLGMENEVKEFLAYKHELETFYDYRAGILLARRSG